MPSDPDLTMVRRRYPEAPIVAVGAVVRDGDRVLLIRRGQEPRKGEWSLPGGVAELGETLEQAVCREVLEETGLRVEAVCVIEVLESISRDCDGRVEYHYVLIDYQCRILDGDLSCATDAADARWVVRDDWKQFGLGDQEVSVILKAAAP